MWEKFQKLVKTRSKSDYEDIMQYLYQFMQTWPIIQKLQLEQRFNLKLEDLAYFNVLKCKCNKGSNISKALYTHCLQKTTLIQLDILQPKVILCLGKAPYELLANSKWNKITIWIIHPSGGEWRHPVEKVQERIHFAREFIKKNT